MVCDVTVGKVDELMYAGEAETGNTCDVAVDIGMWLFLMVLLTLWVVFGAGLKVGAAGVGDCELPM